MTDAELKMLILLVYKYTNIRLTENKKQMLQLRLKVRLRELELTTYGDYIQYLESNISEVELFIDSVTTNETYFFRTQRIWSYLEDEYIKNFLYENPNQCLNIWSAACSTGEEPYSLAMVLESIKCKYPNLKYKILATDISNKVLNFAKKGVYKGRTIDMLTKNRPEFKPLYFEKNGDSYIVKPMLKNNISFKQHNLFQNLTENTNFHLVLLRNVLIYFNETDQQKVIKKISKSSTDESLLVIGESESITRYSTDYKYLLPLFYKKTKFIQSDVA